MGLKIRIFGGFELVHSLIMVDKPGPGFGRVRICFFRIWAWDWLPFLAEHVQSSDFLERFERVRSSVLEDEPGFE